MNGLGFSMLSISHYIRTVLAFLYLYPSLCVADLGVEDPTRPVYAQPASAQLNGEDAELEDDSLSEIPPLNQLVFSKTRQIAMFGDVFVRKGDETSFGRVVDIRKDRVILDVEGSRQDILFLLDDIADKDALAAPATN